MKLKRALALFLTLAMLVGTLTVFPARAHTLASPMLEKGPQAVLANVTAPTTPSYGLFDCQVGQDVYVCYDPYQMRHAYRTDNLLKAGYDGKGKTIVIIDSFQSPNIVNELNTFDSFYGLPALNGLGGPKNSKLGTFTQVAPDGLTAYDATNDDMIGWAMEITLDVVWAHAIAPGANITLVLAKSDLDSDILSATQYAINNNLGDVISQSFGENESCVDTSLLNAEHVLFAKAALKNITVLASTGDDGAAEESCADPSSYVLAASSPASDPLVTAVGGTELHAAGYCLASLGCNPKKNPAPGTYQGELVWNESDYGSSGGGFSVLYKQPFYQLLAFHSNKGRGIPDISYDASVYYGVLTYVDIPGYGTGWTSFGGTSAGSPQWAAIVAMADQKAGHDLGFINLALYLIGANKKSYATDFFDITSGNNSVVENVPVTGFNAGPGWDATTGLGSPAVDLLVNDLVKTVSAGDAKQGSQISGPSGNHSGHGHVFTH